MKQNRATIDERVLQAWTERTARFSKFYGPVQVALVVSTVLLVSWLIYAPSNVLVVLVFVSVIALVVLQVRMRLLLLCPHCNKPPSGHFARGTHEDADMCVHCYYWLRHPIRSTDSGA